MDGLTGKRIILDHVRKSFTGDPWDTVCEWQFALAAVVWVEEQTLMPGYRPSPMIRRREDLGKDWAVTVLLDLLSEGLITTADMQEVYVLLGRAASILRAMGRAY